MGLLCAVVRLTSTHQGGTSLPSDNLTNFQQQVGLVMSKTCLYILFIFYLFYAFSPLMSLCLVESPIPPTWEKNIRKNKRERVYPNAIRTYEQVVLVYHNRQNPSELKTIQRGLALAFFCPTMSLDATLLFPETKELSRRISLCSGSTFL